MIIKSLIKDESRLTLECAKATVTKGAVIDLPDECYKEREVRNAIRMGLLEVVGEPPALSGDGDDVENTIRLQNKCNTKLTFECLKDYVDPGKFIKIPESKLSNPEVDNAISLGYLVDPEADAVIEGPSSPAMLDEVTIKGALAPKKSRKVKGKGKGKVKGKVKVGRTRTQGKNSSKVKARKISPVAESGLTGAQDDLFSESKVIVPGRKAVPEAPSIASKTGVVRDKEVAEDKTGARFEFVDVFGNDS